ncbi:MAG TPA: hypothetical protein DD412_06495 [Holosporales bacterium]|nr:hypothetical protein [Holosporales bacterium]
MKKMPKSTKKMPKRTSLGLFFLLSLFTSFLLSTDLLYGATKRPVPRFVSLRSSEIKMRVGPGREYPVKWVLQRKGLPVKVIAEYDTWRQVECHDGTSGWIHQSLLTGKRTLMVTHEKCRLLSSANRDAHNTAKLTPLTLLPFKLKDCKSGRCYVNAQGTKGWVPKDHVWGLLDNE